MAGPVWAEPGEQLNQDLQAGLTTVIKRFSVLDH
jgi:hypothetical protein